jgi:hypothetical protein
MQTDRQTYSVSQERFLFRHVEPVKVNSFEVIWKTAGAGRWEKTRATTSIINHSHDYFEVAEMKTTTTATTTGTAAAAAPTIGGHNDR